MLFSDNTIISNSYHHHINDTFACRMEETNVIQRTMSLIYDTTNKANVEKQCLETTLFMQKYISN